MSTKSLQDRFWAKVDRSGGPDACWPWLGAKNTDGYGQINVNGKRVSAHRLAYKLATGKSLGALHGRHKCNHRWCANPAHIEPGTISENARDRAAAGVSNKRALTPELVAQLRQAYANGEQLVELTRRAGISRISVYRMLKGVTYRDQLVAPAGERVAAGQIGEAQ